MLNLYNILGINYDANESEIKNAFRKLAQQYHPDINKDKNATNKFQEIQQAYAILSNIEKRKQYNQLISGVDFTLEQSENFYKKYGTIKKYKKQDPNFKVEIKPPIRIKKLEYAAYIVFGFIMLYTIVISIYNLYTATSIEEYNLALNNIFGALVLNILFFGSIFYLNKRT